MKFKVKVNDILVALNSVAATAPSRSTSLIYVNVLVQVGDNVQLTTFDGLNKSESVFSPITKEHGETTIPFKKLYDLVKTYDKDSDITLELKKNKVMVSCGRSRPSLPTLPASDFPDINISDDNVISEVEIDCSELYKKICSIDYAQARNDVRYMLNGVYFKSEGDTIDLVATDGHRLALNKVEAEVTGVLDIIVPTDGLSAIKNMIKDGGDLYIKVSQNLALFSVGSEHLVVQLIDSRYPDYKRVIPSGESSCLTVNANDFNKTAKRAMISSESISGGFKTITMSVSKDPFDENCNVMLVSRDQTKAESIEYVAGNFDDEDYSVSFNGQYMSQAIQSTLLPDVEIRKYKSGNEAIVIEEDDYLCVIMPQRL